MGIKRETVRASLYIVRCLIKKYKNKQDICFSEFLAKSTIFDGVQNLDETEIVHFDVANGWSLPVVILTCLAMAFPGIDGGTTNNLLKTVKQGLSYAQIAEENLNKGHPYEKTQTIAEKLWVEVDNNCTCLEIILKKMDYQGIAPRDILSSFFVKAEMIMQNFMRGFDEDENYELPHKMVVANAMRCIVD